ncbi:MAG TPA: copper-containing nitrite reductase, partial [Candidatus Binatia bacterium]|nr:copper-containing nitrite reductase [Candidatus Binatia bacterium]
MQKSTHYRITTTAWIFVLSLLVFMPGAHLLQAQAVGHHMAMGSATGSAKVADIVRDPADVPPPVGNRAPTTVHVSLTAEEVVGALDPANGTTYRYWTFNGKVPGPMIRVRQGDAVEVTLHNDASSHMAHSVDFHAALGPGGGAALSQTPPGQTKTFTFEATTPGLFVYHCGTPMIGDHIANGMYGLILVEPPAGLAQVDHEYYVMQGEIYTAAPMGKPGLQQFSGLKLMQEAPEYFVFNGAVGALTKEHPMQAKVGETVRIFFGDAGPNATSSVHMVGQIFTKLYDLGTLTSPPLTSVQTASVPPGGAAMLELTASQPGKFAIMDHAMARMPKGLMAMLEVAGAENAQLMHAGPAFTESGGAESAHVTGMTQADIAEATSGLPPATVAMSGNGGASAAESGVDAMPGMSMDHDPAMSGRAVYNSASAAESGSLSPSAEHMQELNGCLTLRDDGKAMLKVLNSS